MRVCMSVCLSLCPKISFELNDFDLKSKYLACWFILTLSGSNLKVKVIGQTVTTGGKFSLSVKDAHYDVTCFRLSVELFVLKWSMRPRVRNSSLDVPLMYCMANLCRRFALLSVS